MGSLDQVTSAPRAVRVSMRTAVWTVLYMLSALLSAQPCDRILHVQASDDFGALERLSLAVLGSEVHETGPSDTKVSVFVLCPTSWPCTHLILG
jgi:hypothetical protein